MKILWCGPLEPGLVFNNLVTVSFSPEDTLADIKGKLKVKVPNLSERIDQLISSNNSKYRYYGYFGLAWED